MAKPTDPTWDHRLEEEAARLVREIITEGLHLRKDVLSIDAVPLFLWRDGDLRVIPREELASGWEKDPQNIPDDWEFIRELRRADLPDGSFFVLLPPPTGKGNYHWILHTP